MAQFAAFYKDYVKDAFRSENQFGFDVRMVARIEPLLKFLYNNWWKVNFQGLERLPKEGPALIVGNSGGLVPWAALMLLYALMSNKNNPYPRRVHLVADLDWINDERVYTYLVQLGFVPWSADNLKHLFANGQLVAAFPEGLQASAKPFTDRYRILDFDWTRLLSAVEENVPILPLATLGCEEAVPTIANLDWLAKFLNMPAFPVTPFFPWYPFPLNLGSLPIQWRMSLLNNSDYPQGSNRDTIEETAKSQSRFIEGEIQAELNRLLRARGR
ncbi:MAG TPA: 1-acyl-sn-glycerol-3-phosphate acyltransferase [Planktothrix sp.]|jgi:1-acyl-sn-glycerol-3-phosphate acyltransferase